MISGSELHVSWATVPDTGHHGLEWTGGQLAANVSFLGR